jgi:hypothetical protein
LKVLGGSVIERGRKNRTNIRKQVVKNPATLYQTIRRRVLLTGGSGVDSTTTAGLAAALATGVAAPRAGGGIGGPAGFSVTAKDSVFGLVSTPTISP